MSSEIYSVAIIGAGRIACGFDAPESERILTHAHAVKRNPRLALAAIVDTDSHKAAEAEKWGTRFFTDIDAMLPEIKPDIVIIATPDATHAGLVERAVSFSPKLIICEKPVATSGDEASRLRKLDTVSVPIIVNFSRRFDPTAREIHARLTAGEYGTVLSATGIYTKGIFHNGSHMLDLARFMFGEMTAAHAHARIDDFPEGEPSIGAMLSFERCPQFHLVAADARAFAVFELDILTHSGRIRFADEGGELIMQRVIDDPAYAGFRILGETEARKTGLSNALSGLMTHAIDVLDGRAQPEPSLDDALKTHSACAKIVESLKAS